jgi:glycerophosphoryl diester phosphodiesterase
MIPSALSPSFLHRPIAHRGLHGPDCPENSLAAARAAIMAGYGIELDVQLSRDRRAMVFHDETLNRMTGATGPLHARDAANLSGIALNGGAEGIPTLMAMLDLVGGQVPLLIEIKDQDRAGPCTGPLEADVARLLNDYPGAADWVAVMSFSAASMAEMARLAPGIPRGLITWSWPEKDTPDLSDATRAHLRDIADFDAVGASFVSHEAADLTRPAVKALRARGVPVLCWTITSPEAEGAARVLADNVTFSGYRPAHLSPTPKPAPLP